MDGILNNYKKDLVNINNQLSIGQTNVKNDIEEGSCFEEKAKAAGDSLEISEQGYENAAKDVEAAKQSRKSIEASITATEGKIAGLEVKLATAPDDKKEEIQKLIAETKDQLEKQKAELTDANGAEANALGNQQRAEEKLNEAKTTAQDTNRNIEENKTKQSEDQKKVDSLTEEQSSLEAQIEAEEAKEADEAPKTGEIPTFDEAMSRATDNIKNADGSFDKNADGKSSHLEQSLALANQSEEDRAAIQEKLKNEFANANDNFDKNADDGNFGYGLEDNHLDDINEVTGMFGGNSAENVAKAYQCAVPLNGDDVFKMEADTLSELLDESKNGFSDANKEKILNALDNGLQGYTPVNGIYYNRQAEDVLSREDKTLSDVEIQSQIDTIKAKVSGENTEPLTETEFRTITYLYDIEAGGGKIGITNWDGSLGIQEGQKFSKQATYIINNDTVSPIVYPQGENEPGDKITAQYNPAREDSTFYMGTTAIRYNREDEDGNKTAIAQFVDALSKGTSSDGKVSVIPTQQQLRGAVGINKDAVLTPDIAYSKGMITEEQYDELKDTGVVIRFNQNDQGGYGIKGNTSISYNQYISGTVVSNDTTRSNIGLSKAQELNFSDNFTRFKYEYSLANPGASDSEIMDAFLAEKYNYNVQ